MNKYLNLKSWKAAVSKGNNHHNKRLVTKYT